MTDTTTSIPPEKSEKTYPQVPRADADSRSLYEFIAARYQQKQDADKWTSYHLCDFLKDTAQADMGNMLSPENLNGMFATQIRALNASFQFMMHASHRSSSMADSLKVQRHFCESIRLVHQMDKYNNPPVKD